MFVLIYQTENWLKFQFEFLMKRFVVERRWCIDYALDERLLMGYDGFSFHLIRRKLSKCDSVDFERVPLLVKRRRIFCAEIFQFHMKWIQFEIKWNILHIFVWNIFSIFSFYWSRLIWKNHWEHF